MTYYKIIILSSNPHIAEQDIIIIIGYTSRVNMVKYDVMCYPSKVK